MVVGDGFLAAKAATSWPLKSTQGHETEQTTNEKRNTMGNLS